MFWRKSTIRREIEVWWKPRNILNGKWNSYWIWRLIVWCLRNYMQIEKDVIHQGRRLILRIRHYKKTMLVKEYLHNEPIVKKKNQNFCNQWIMKIVREHDELFIIEFTDGTWTINWHTYNSHFEVAFPYFYWNLRFIRPDLKAKRSFVSSSYIEENQCSIRWRDPTYVKPWNKAFVYPNKSCRAMINEGCVCTIKK